MKSSADTLKQLDESPLSSFHLKTVLTSGMGFFTDAYAPNVIWLLFSRFALGLGIGGDYPHTGFRRQWARLGRS